MDFKTIDEINSLFNENGIFLIRKDNGSEFVYKTGSNTKNFIRLNTDEELRIANFIISNTINPFIDFSKNNVRQYATRVNLDTINDYLKKQDEIDKLQRLHNKLIKCEYISVGDHCFQLNHNGKIGLWLIDKELVLDNDIVEFDENIKTIEKALYFTDATNRFKEAYDLEMSKFNEIAICKFKK